MVPGDQDTDPNVVDRPFQGQLAAHGDEGSPCGVVGRFASI